MQALTKLSADKSGDTNQSNNSSKENFSDKNEVAMKKDISIIILDKYKNKKSTISFIPKNSFNNLILIHFVSLIYLDLFI